MKWNILTEAGEAVLCVILKQAKHEHKTASENEIFIILSLFLNVVILE